MDRFGLNRVVEARICRTRDDTKFYEHADIYVGFRATQRNLEVKLLIPEQGVAYTAIILFRAHGSIGSCIGSTLEPHCCTRFSLATYF